MKSTFRFIGTGQGAISLIFNLNNGSVTQQEYTGFGAYSTSARRVSQGWFFTIYFNTPAGAANTVIGITPNGASPVNSQGGRFRSRYGHSTRKSLQLLRPFKMKTQLEIDSLIKNGEIAKAQSHLREYSIARIPRKDLAGFANLARRLGCLSWPFERSILF